MSQILKARELIVRTQQMTCATASDSRIQLFNVAGHSTPETEVAILSTRFAAQK